jgi:hypothetical protein
MATYEGNNFKKELKKGSFFQKRGKQTAKTGEIN